MTLWALEIEYDGTPFMGWQRQKHGLAVQQVVEEAAARVKGGGEVSEAVASGRTDAGVHAAAQIVQIELPDFTPFRVREAMNFHLKPHPIVVLRACPAPEGWNARFSSIGRTYRYVISNRAVPPALEAKRVWHLRQRLDEQAMHQAAQRLLGHHDFSSFRASACQAKSPLRTLDRLDVARRGEKIIIEAAARSFLHHQVRNMVGSLVKVGEGAWTAQKLAEVLGARNRAVAAQTAPPEGLYFTGVAYDPPLALE
ncbi:tRNA pseudouridine(38-40) synthase TruA [Acidocella sp.]|uniref:tRNA pseudouridine(38-40) synthase TruA n=1 Tax=Acidocella sp. TaxID=50710 RepID=UPI00262AAAEC|nr:tRNA pseudouridine(38-40) synthase TruA [Acidocella sp.]